MGIESIVNVQISLQTQGVTRAGFGIPLILGPNAGFSGIRTYSSLTGVAADFATSTDEYKMARAIFSQAPRPTQVKIRDISTPVVQVNTITPDVTVQEVFAYEVTINGELFSFTSDATPTAAEVVTGLIALINASSQPVTASGTTTLILTSDSAGLGFTVAVGARLANVPTTPNVGISTDILAAVQEDANWYALLTTNHDDVTIKDAAATIEALRKIYLVRDDSSDIKTAVTTDILSFLKNKTYLRTGILWSGTPNDMGDAAWEGRVLPLDPGSETWAFKTLAGVTVDSLTDSEQNFLDGKNGNYYIQVAGINITKNGKMAGGEYIDVVRFRDWLQARIEEDVFAILANSDKVPYTDGGIAIIESALRKVLREGQQVGGIIPDFVNDSNVLVPGFTVTVPSAADISDSDKASRTLRDVEFTAQLAGAIHAVEIFGVITL